MQTDTEQVKSMAITVARIEHDLSLLKQQRTPYIRGSGKYKRLTNRIARVDKKLAYLKKHIKSTNSRMRQQKINKIVGV